MMRGTILRTGGKIYFSICDQKKKKGKAKVKWQRGKNIFNLYHNNVNIPNILKVSINRESKPNNPIPKTKQNKTKRYRNHRKRNTTLKCVKMCSLLLIKEKWKIKLQLNRISQLLCSQPMKVDCIHTYTYSHEHTPHTRTHILCWWGENRVRFSICL